MYLIELGEESVCGCGRWMLSEYDVIIGIKNIDLQIIIQLSDVLIPCCNSILYVAMLVCRGGNCIINILLGGEMECAGMVVGDFRKYEWNVRIGSNAHIFLINMREELREQKSRIYL